VQRPFYPEGRDVCHVYLLHPPGGLVPGDSLEVDVNAGEGAQVLVTAPAATKIYRSDGRGSSLVQTLRVAAGAVLEWLPQAHPQRQAVLGVLGRLASAIAHGQDRATGVWWQVLDQPGRPENYREASASSMFVYALSKAIHNGWLDKAAYSRVASRGYQGLLAEFVELRSDGQLDLKNVCKEAGLGGKPYRDGSYAYYTSTEVVKNDPKGIGAFILAALENE